MDLGGRRHYVALAMEFLLFLSAVLSAVTGAFTGARAPEARVHHETAARSIAVAEPSVTVAVPAARTEAVLPAVTRTAAVDALPVFAPAASVPLYADRLIE